MVSSLEHDLFAGEGEVRALCRSRNWAQTALGPPDAWPPTLRTVVRAALDSPFPINLWCGPDLNLIYNDAYTNVLGSKHPHALGAHTRTAGGTGLGLTISRRFARLMGGDLTVRLLDRIEEVGLAAMEA